MSALRRLDSYGLLAILLTAFAVAPLLAPGYFWGAHDARHSVYFLMQFDASIQDGVLYPRWQPDINFGYGYPFFSVYSPGVFFLGEAFHLLGLDFTSSVKAVFALSFILSALAMYLYGRRVLGSRAAAVVAATLYVYVPYHLADVYLRAALADSFCFVFFPLVLLGFHDLIENPRPRALALAGAALAGLMFSHYPLALLFLPFLALYALALWAWQWARLHRYHAWRQALKPLLWAIGAGLYAIALAGILIVPAALEYRFVRTDQWAGGYYSYKDHFVYLFQFLAPTWGSGPGSVAGAHDTLPFQLGAVPVVLSILSLLVLFLLRRAGRAADVTPTVAFHQVATVIIIVLMLGLAAPLWETLRLATFAQFPWRLLSLTTLTMALLGGTIPLVDERPAGTTAQRSLAPAALAAIVAAVILGSYAYLRVEMIDPPEGPVSTAGLMRFMQSSGEMTGMLGWATRDKPIEWSPLAEVMVQGGQVTDKVMRELLPAGAQATTTRHTTTSEEVVVDTPSATDVGFYTSYFPGWQASVDGQPVEITPAGDLGYITVPVPAGRHAIVLSYNDTWPRTLGTLLSLSALVLGVFLLGVFPVRRP